MIRNKEELYDKCENIEQLYDNYYLPLAKEKQDLIKYLEDKIKVGKESIDRLGETLDDYFEHKNIIKLTQIHIEIYQEILDKIKEGNYE